MRALVVNADDFGRSWGVNRGVARAHDEGIVTSASLLVRWLMAPEAVELAAERPRLGVGLHLDLGEWEHQDGDWLAVYELVDLGDEGAVEREALEQLRRFRALVGRDPTHLDSHQHVHRSGAAAAVAQRLARKLRVPLRGTGEINYRGDFFGQTAEGAPYPEGITVDNLVRVLKNLPVGVTEVGCHPGEDPGEDSAYGEERVQELHALCDERVHVAVREEEITLGSFAELARMEQA